ncbi:DUF3857 domain-containing protein [Mucilaginibacter sp. UYCu711]|uniref:DUF3857 domain-containing protein n=1 Tax=Mucilaginibacter sp. UYCu711 TaxID=3156339 RepID=UPI003D25B19E
MKKFLLVKLFLLSLFTAVNAQNFTVGSVEPEELDMKFYKNDRNAHAVILKEYGESFFFPSLNGVIALVHEYHVKIKIFDNEGLKYGSVEIPLSNTDDIYVAEEVNDVAGITTYKDDKGSVQTEEFDPYKIRNNRQNKNHKTVKFTMPGLRPGCIVDYTYRIVSPFLQNYHTWLFQGEIPKIISTYDTRVPAFWSYKIMLRGNLKLTRNSTSIATGCFLLGSQKIDCAYALYEMTDIPAFVKEDYMSTPKNFMAGVYFEQSQYTSLFSDKRVDVNFKWEEVDKFFQLDPNLGALLKKLDFLKARLTPVIVGITDPYEQARAVYKYIQRSVKWDSIFALRSDNIRKALDNKRASDSGDINLLLVAALKAAGLNSCAVILSTRDHGAINSQLPSTTAFNYLVAQVDLGDRVYLLDATDPLLPFGILPLRCLNDNGRVLSADKPAHWTDLTAYQNQSSTYLFNLKQDDNGKLKGTLTTRFPGYAGYEKRALIKKYGDTKKYIDSLEESLPGLKISRSAINNLDSLDMPVSEDFDIEVDTKENGDVISFNPYLINHIITNPFKAESRRYPVDFVMPSDLKIILNISLSDNYTIANSPASAGVSLPDQGGRFSTTFQPADNALAVTNTLS